ncbi:MAG: DUF2924 domain-containing protein [Inhella sp.]
MTAHTPHTDAATITARIAQLPHLPMDSLWALWDEHFDERPNHHHRTWLESRLAYKIQERALGGLKSSVRRKLEEIGETGILPRQLRRDANRLLPGTVLTRMYDDIEHRVLVRGPFDFDYRGQRFKSLSAVARHITGTHWSGPVFFGLKSGDKKQEPA